MRRLLLILSICMMLIPATTFAQDTDNDGVADSIDNCPNYWNPEQYDADGDSIGNVCDECTDADADGYGDFGFPTNTCPEDNCPGFYNPDQLDTDGDGIGDLCEGLACGDINGDGNWIDINDFVYFCRWFYLGGQAPASIRIGNVGGCQKINVVDLGWLVCSMFSGCWIQSCDDTTECEPLPGLGEVTLDAVDGLTTPDTILTGTPVTFRIRFSNSGTDRVFAMTNGFRIYSPTGTDWGGTSALRLDSLTQFYDLTNNLCLLGVTGNGADTISSAFAPVMMLGMPGESSSLAHSITIGPIDHSQSGGTVCLDSCWFPPAGEWLWTGPLQDHNPTLPSWDGPHCFTVVRCCEPRGDVDHSGIGPDIADLVYLVSYMFQDGPAPVCPEKADINGDGIGPDIADLVYLVTFMFQDGPPPAPCE